MKSRLVRKRLGKPVWLRLLGMGQRDSERTSITEQGLESRKIEWRRDGQISRMPANMSIARGSSIVNRRRRFETASVPW